MIVYDHHFNLNEWTILIELFVGLIVILLLPKRFSRKMMIIIFIIESIEESGA